MCKFCETYDFGMVGYCFDDGRGMVYFPSHVGNIPGEERFKFCPACGKALPVPGAENTVEMKLVFVQRQEADRDGKHYTRDTYTIDEYKVEVDDTTYMDDGKTLRSISVIRPFERSDAERYIPEIYYRDGYFDDKEPCFEIQTVSYGSLAAEDYALFLAAQEKAVKVAEILTKEFITKQQEG